MSPTPRPSLTPAAVVDNFSVSFAGRQVLHNLNLELPAHRLTVIIGPSGSGKTTFLRGFNRLNECFPRCQTRGGIRLRVAEGWWEIYGKDSPLTELRRRVGMVFQAPNVLPLSIAKNISLPLDLVLGWPRRDLPARVEWALQQTHLWEEVQDRLDAPAATLSGGQQQRLCLARALALGPDLLMLDEPTASLDFRAALKIEELITHLKERYTILAVSHSLRQARRLADQILVFKEGAIVRTLKREEIQQPGIFHHLVEEIF